MNDDVPEVNGPAPPMLPGSFLHEKEPGSEARHYPQLQLCIWMLLFVHSLHPDLCVIYPDSVV